MRSRAILFASLVTVLTLAGGFLAVNRADQPVEQAARSERSHARAQIEQFVKQYCSDCHNAKDKTAGLELDGLGLEDVNERSDVWEKVVRKLVGRQMPPADAPRPTPADYN